MTIIKLLLLLFAYLSGSIPFGYLLTKRSTGLNILEQGSGNIGSTNVARIAGKKVAIAVQILDMLKGLIPVGLVFLLQKLKVTDFPDYFIFFQAFATIIGHDFSIFLHLRGGKGVNTTLGATVLMAPLSVFCAVAVYYFIKWRFKYVSTGSLALAITLTFATVILYPDNYLWAYLFACSCLIIIRHIPNLRRLRAGKELH
jgi:acyl phosphate:glycerol-3-phosphate acyltransferase